MTLAARMVRSLPFSSMDLTAQEDVDAETESALVLSRRNPPVACPPLPRERFRSWAESAWVA
jgi:hypothetical protein